MKQIRWWTVVAGCLVSGTALGAGFQLYTEGSAEALGQAGAIGGRDDLVSLAWYNPSALAGAERPAIMVGSTFVQIQTDFTSPAGNASMSDDWRTIPHLYYVQPINGELTAMLSINAPYGLITEWPDGWAGQALALYSDLETIYVTPSVAWAIDDKLSVSAGFNVVRGEAELSNTTFGRLEGDDVGYGGTASVHFEPVKDWAVGARYQSRVELEIEGELNGAVSASADLRLPSSVNMGVANTSIDNLSLGFDVVWTEWSTYDKLAIVPVGVSPKLWSNVWSIRVGGEYALGDSWKLRAGYVWDESPVPDSTRSPEMPGSDHQMVMAGVGWKWNNIGIDAAYSYLWADKADMGTIYPLPGEFETTTHLVALSASYEF